MYIVRSGFDVAEFPDVIAAFQTGADQVQAGHTVAIEDTETGAVTLGDTIPAKLRYMLDFSRPA